MAKKDRNEKKKTQKEINMENLKRGIHIVYQHPLFSSCSGRIYTVTKNDIGKLDWAEADKPIVKKLLEE